MPGTRSVDRYIAGLLKAERYQASRLLRYPIRTRRQLAITPCERWLAVTFGLRMQNAYTFLILEAYEDEVAGAVYFDALAVAYPQKSAFLERCAALERVTASQLSTLIRKYQMTPRPERMLAERGAIDALKDSDSNWTALMQRSVASYARYVTDFKALEAIGAPESQPILAALTEHEVQLIEWMRGEAAS